MNILNKIHKDYSLPIDLYTRIKQCVKQDSNQEIDDLNAYLEELPHKLKVEVSFYLHEDTYMTMRFLKDKQMSFIAWICPLLKPQIANENQYVFFEGEEIDSMYFLKQGTVNFVLPKFDNAKYIHITTGTNFGMEDIVSSIIKNEDIDQDDWISKKDIMTRQFTIMASEQATLLVFSVIELNKMQVEFLELYESLFKESYNRLEQILAIKLKSIKQCQKKRDNKTQLIKKYS
jgi:CRP-like cAMP-binding protein